MATLRSTAVARSNRVNAGDRLQSFNDAGQIAQNRSVALILFHCASSNSTT